MVVDEVDDAGDENVAAGFGEGHVRKCAGPEPSTDGDEDGEGGILLLQGDEGGEILIIVGETGDDAAVLDVGKGVVDTGEFLRGDVAGVDWVILRKDVGDDDGLGCI